jgi:meso-butanediol dehydrogenase/(S,S)-butanediol dehydrogenase/diacetyl reductase
MRLENKKAIVTGGASGIGAATVAKFVAEGAQVVFSDINELPAQTIIEQLGADNVSFIKCDVGDSEQISALIDQSLQTLGRIDILFNNAGISGFGETPDIDDQQWFKVMDVDLHSVFFACREVIPLMKAQGGGAIVNTASISGLRGDYGMAAYNAAKGAVANLTRTMALDHAKDNIRVNALCPGLIDTQITSILKHMDEYEAFLQSELPMGRAGTAEEMANVVAFLASDEASYVSGVNMVADGAKTCHTGMMNYTRWATNAAQE